MDFALSVSDLINVIFIAAGLGICGMSILHVGSGMHIRPQVRQYFQVFFTLINVYISMHLIRMLMEGHTNGFCMIGIHIVTFIEFLVTGFMIYLLSLLILFIANPGKVGKVTNYIFLALLLIHVVGLVIAQFTGFYYYFDDGNIYHRGPGYVCSNVMHILMLVQNIFLLTKYRKNFDPRLRSALWIYLLAPLAAIAIQIFTAEVQLIILVTVVAAVYLYYIIILIQTEKYEVQKKDKERLDTELTMATRIQAETLPNIFPPFPDRKEFNIYASMNPAKEVGGDFYDFFLIDEDHLGIVMADVSGKGIPAALFMMVSKILIQNCALMGHSPKEVLEIVNQQICSNNPERMFVTVWYGRLNIRTGTLTAANAGHEYPIIKNPDGHFEILKDKHGLVIGAMEGMRYKEYDIELKPGSKIFLYTDGVPEATNAAEELFGMDRLVKALGKTEKETPQKILENVTSAVGDFVQKAQQFDDLTMLCLEYLGVENETGPEEKKD